MVDFIEFDRNERIHGSLNISIKEFKHSLNRLNLSDYAVTV